ncbi:MAG: RNA methyltransferase [Bacillota bacterium]|nr:RNA methyltransferase [Bacillota bacterium]
MQSITSRQNPLLKQTIKLKARKQRDKEGLYIIEGYHLLWEAVNGGVPLRHVFFQETPCGAPLRESRELAAALEEKGVFTACLPPELFALAAEAETPQGVLAAAEKPRAAGDWFPRDRRQGGGNVLVADRIQDPGNMGTLIRTADAAGCLGMIVLKGTVDVYSPKVVRSAAGSLFRLPLLFLDTPEQALKILRENGKRSVCTGPCCDVYYYDVDMRENVALIIGNEGEGACRAFMEGADVSVKIPMAEGTESLNAAVAAGVLLYESVRQRSKKMVPMK